ncbi:PREDICTED: uncharacterized protein LOC105570364 [Vollenhovia emeryi]|uniref:uncharacterized protein LOC105570364 n=1 Tax=Vollenhovia emeryi TaxID=411798 RepID=UPI0005F41258|nr:PREDICTED: uncharacterized protein LOC105570364 [Vollenhovia emeryi]
MAGKVTGFRGNTTLTSEVVTAMIKSKTSNYSESLKFTVIDQITSRIPDNRVEISKLRLPESISVSQLADPTFHIPQKIDLLLGTSVFWNILRGRRIQLSKDQPIFQQTNLGWIIGGNLTPIGTTFTNTCCTITNEDLNRRSLTPEEVACEKHFDATTNRDEEGRFVVSLPIKGDIKRLGDSEYNARRRLKSMERRFGNDSVLHLRYLEFMREYRTMGHMELVPEAQGNQEVVNYLPHHGVTREESTTTKLRVVFDASCQTSSGEALNHLLMVGPKIQPELAETLIRFRQHNYVLTADITKMFRQIKIAKRDRALQRILWRENPEDPVCSYELTTVTYGTASAPYHAQKCLQRLAIESAEVYPEAAAAILSEFYMDDWLTGSDSKQKLQQLKCEVMQILATAGMELRKWHSNAQELLASSEAEQPLTSSEETKTLGIRWNSREDTFKFKVTLPMGTCRSKRSILSTIVQIYDPLGLIGPVVVKAKLFMRKLWKLNVGWDDKIPTDLLAEWSSYQERLHAMEEIQMPRQVVSKEAKQVEMHGFCDASQSAYGACLYLCSTDTEGNRTTRLLIAKSRIAPLKVISIPRLELCGAVLLARLAFKVRKIITLPISRYNYWSDSSIVVHWVQGDPARYKVFVANRVSEIQGLTCQREWRHVPTGSNPADVLSRGIDPRDLPRAEMWWSGPTWLAASPDKRPNAFIRETPEDPKEKIKGNIFLTRTSDEYELFERFSSLPKLRRVVAQCYRFMENCRNNRMQRRIGPLEVDDLIRANTALVKLAQRQAFALEIGTLEGKEKSIPRTSRLLALNPFLDKERVLRVGGRLKNALLSYEQRFPTILPSNHILSTLLIRETHYKNLHAGLNTISAIIRESYWIVSARSEIRRVLRKCILCFRKTPPRLNQIMGNLPATRVNPGRPFAHTGIDYAGPFTIRISRNKNGKAYLAVFVCMATKAVHLEVVSNLSTAAFLNTLKRFIARRGKSCNLYSDNGRNFVGARNELNDIARFLQSESLRNKVLDFTAEQSIKWTFIPSYSLHVGGLWEAAVKSAKSHLKTVVGQISLTFEELTTVFAQIEAILNSRPLTPLSGDPADLNALTPGHFLIGSSLTAMPEPQLAEVPLNRLTRFQLISKLVQGFWKRWAREYVTQLQTRQKWKKLQEHPHLKIGALVMLRDDNAPPLQWRLGRITEMFKGSDGLIRTLEIKTSFGLTKRAIQKICILPLEE